MWWDPSIAMDLDFLEIVPAFRMAELERYPISAQQLRNLANMSVNQRNLSASLGALIMWQCKSKGDEASGGFETNALANLDRCFFMMSESTMQR